MKRVMLLPSSDGQEFVQIFGVPDEMTEAEAKEKMTAAVNEFDQADRLWAKSEDRDQPLLNDFVAAKGFIVFDSVIDGPQWD